MTFANRSLPLVICQPIIVTQQFLLSPAGTFASWDLYASTLYHCAKVYACMYVCVNVCVHVYMCVQVYIHVCADVSVHAFDHCVGIYSASKSPGLQKSRLAKLLGGNYRLANSGGK